MSDFQQWPGFKVPPNDPSREVKSSRPTITIAEPREEDSEVLKDSEMYDCEECDSIGTVDCHCGGDLCVCRWHGERPCPKCGGF